MKILYNIILVLMFIILDVIEMHDKYHQKPKLQKSNPILKRQKKNTMLVNLK